MDEPRIRGLPFSAAEEVNLTPTLTLSLTLTLTLTLDEARAGGEPSKSAPGRTLRRGTAQGMAAIGQG